MMNPSNGWRRRRLTLLTILLLGLALAPTAGAAPEEHPLLDHYSLVLGGFLSTADTDVRLDLDRIERGTIIDFEDVLDLREDDTLFRVDFSWRLGRRHQLNLGYYELNRTATAVLPVDIEFGDETFTVDTEVSSFFNTEFIDLSYTYWFRIQERHVIGFSVGAVVLAVDTGVGLSTDRLDLGGIEADATSDIPVPLLGLHFRQQLAPKWMLRAEASVIDIGSFDDYSGSLVNISAGVEHRTFRHVGFGFSYNLIDYDIELEKRLFRGTLQYSVGGFQVFSRVRF